MQQRLTIVSLGVCAFLLALNIGVQLWNSSSPVHGASAKSDEMILVASNTQDAAICFVYNKSKDLLTSYLQRQTGGLHLMGIRSTEHDFPEIDELPRAQDSTTSVDAMKKLAEEIKKRAQERELRKQKQNKKK